METYTKHTDPLLDTLGDAMAFVANSPLPAQIQSEVMRRYERLIEEVRFGDMSQGDFDARMRMIREELSLPTHGEILQPQVQVARRIGGMRKICKAYLGYTVAFGEKYPKVIKQKPALVVDINTKNVTVDQNIQILGSRNGWYNPGIFRFLHREFLQGLGNKDITIIKAREENRE